MDSSHSSESPKADTSEMGTQQVPLRLPPGTPSDTSPSKPIPEIEAITPTVPAWGNTDEALKWFIDLRKILRSITYRYSATIQKAMQIFQDTGATAYRDHEILQNLIDLWDIWKQFTAANTITPEFLRTSAIYFDFGSIVKHMKTPRKVARRYALEMSELRANLKSIAIEVEILRGLIVEIDIRLSELEDGNDVEQFPGLPEVQDRDSASTRSTTTLYRTVSTQTQPTAISSTTRGPTISTQTESTSLSGMSLAQTVSTQTQPSTVSNPHAEKEPELEKSSLREHEEEHDEEENEKDDKDLFYNFEVRTQDEMDIELFDPVWEPDRPFPGEIPAELSEYLGSPGDPPLGSYPQFLGSSRTIFWLAGYDMMVKVIDDPSYVLQDEIVSCPEGCSAGAFLLERYAHEGKVPPPIVDKFNGFTPSEDDFEVWTPLDFTPRQVTRNVTALQPKALYPNCRPDVLPNTIQCVNAKQKKKLDVFENDCRKLFDNGLLNHSNLLFRGGSKARVALSMTFFIPVISTSHVENEFGPGIYTTDNFQYAKEYAGSNGAIMVFRDTDYRDLEVWRPNPQEWNSLTATWMQLPVNNISMSPKFKSAEVIIGPISSGGGEARKKKTFLKQSERSQSVFQSYRACERLRDSLVAIIYIEN